MCSVPRAVWAASPGLYEVSPGVGVECRITRLTVPCWTLLPFDQSCKHGSTVLPREDYPVVTRLVARPARTMVARVRSPGVPDPTV